MLQRANHQNLSSFFRSLHALLDAGVGISYALSEMGQRAANRALRNSAAAMSLRTSSGETLHKAMRDFPNLFSPLTLSVIEAAESVGRLDNACAHLADSAQRDFEVQQEIKRETAYSKLLLWVSLVVVPLPIYVPLGAFSFVINPLPQLVFVFGALVIWNLLRFLWPFFCRNEDFRVKFDRWRLRIPHAGKIIHGFALAKFCRTFGLLLQAGIGVSQSLEMAASSCGNAAIARKIRGAIPKIQRGDTLSSALNSTGEFDSFARQMLHTGEEAGAVSSHLEQTAKFLELDTVFTLKQTMTTLFVAIFLLVALKIAAGIIYFWLGYAGMRTS